MSFTPSPPDLDYLTRDYEGFRALLISLLDRSGTAWTERAPADLGISLVEILAYELDHLAYAGDRVAEEGFLGTARRWESVRRHAALGDYRLDRGNASSGDQHFELRAGASLHLPSGFQLSPLLAPGEDPEQRVIFETTESADLDYRRNSFVLARSVGPGDKDLHLCDAACRRVDLSMSGLGRGMRLALVDADGGEIVTVAGVRGIAIDLEVPVRGRYRAGMGPGAARVFGNLVPVRRGRTSDWIEVGLGGASLEDVSASLYLTGRLQQLVSLRRELEDARLSWIDDPQLVQRWNQENSAISRVVRVLRAAQTLSIEEAPPIDEILLEAAEGFRKMLRAIGQSIPDALLPTLRVPIANQKIPLRGEEPPLWWDKGTTLRVLVGDAARWQEWHEVENFLRSGPEDKHYVVELDRTGFATLAFGDGQSGALLQPDVQVMAQWVSGNLQAGNLGAGALQKIISDAPDVFDSSTPTWNPLPTWGARPPEDLAGVPERLKLALALPAVPVTADDYVMMLEARPKGEIAEAAAWIEAKDMSATFPPAKGQAQERRVDVVIRPKVGQDAARVLASTRDWLREARLAGIDVRVSLAEPLFITIVVDIGVDPRVYGADIRLRLRESLLQSFGEQKARIIGVARSPAEVYAAVESIPGVTWSRVVGFDIADRDPPGLREEIIPAPNQMVLCQEIDLRTSPSRPGH